MSRDDPSGRVLVAGMGNILHGDDGFGIEVAWHLLAQPVLPDGLVVKDVGIGGMNLVQDLMDGFTGLILVDAIGRGGEPGTVYELEPIVPDLAGDSDEWRRDFSADMHFTSPSTALRLAHALGVLPPRVRLVGCEPDRYVDFAVGLSDRARSAVAEAAGRILAIVNTWRSSLESGVAQ